MNEKVSTDSDYEFLQIKIEKPQSMPQKTTFKFVKISKGKKTLEPSHMVRATEKSQYLVNSDP